MPEPAAIELNVDAYDVTEIRQQMSRASTCRFSPAASLGDAAALPARQRVKFTYTAAGSPSSRTLFAGRILPVDRTVTPTEDSISYVAADVLEYLSHNPCDEVAEFYNRNSIDDAAYPYPYDQSIEDIIAAEFASVVGVGKPLGTLDWSDVPTSVRDIVLPDFTTKGKTWTGLLEAIAAEVPVLAWWYDPSTCAAGETEGGTLRFYDLSMVPDNPASVNLPVRGGEGLGPVNAERCTISEDISASFDKVTFVAWGDMTEYYEKATIGWDTTLDGKFSTGSGTKYPMRWNQTAGAWQLFAPSVVGGTWTTTGSAESDPWTPRREDRHARVAYRRYKTAHEIVDLRLVREGSPGSYRYYRQDRSMWVEVLKQRWDVGPIVWALGTTLHVGFMMIQEVRKIAVYSVGTVNDYGSVAPDPALYPSYPTLPTVPAKVPIEGPAATEKNYFLLPNALVYETHYTFIGVDAASGEADYANLVGEDITLFWPIGADVWIRYTGKAPLEVVVEDAGLGYSKHAKVYDPRFLKYTNEAGTVLRDDTAMVTDFANMLFALMSKTRVYGQLTVHNDPDTFEAAFPMGCSVLLGNWESDGASRLLPARVQGRVLTGLKHQWRAELSFDSTQTFTSLDHTLRYRQFFTGNEIRGAVMTGEGRAGAATNSGGAGNFGGGGGAQAGSQASTAGVPSPFGGSFGAGGQGMQGGSGIPTAPASLVPPTKEAVAAQQRPVSGEVVGISTTFDPQNVVVSPASPTYSVAVPYDGAPNAVTITGVVPSNRRRPSSETAIVPAQLGTPVFIVYDESTGQPRKYLIIESDYIGPDC